MTALLQPNFGRDNSVGFTTAAGSGFKINHDFYGDFKIIPADSPQRPHRQPTDSVSVVIRSSIGKVHSNLLLNIPPPRRRLILIKFPSSSISMPVTTGRPCLSAKLSFLPIPNDDNYFVSGSAPLPAPPFPLPKWDRYLHFRYPNELCRGKSAAAPGREQNCSRRNCFLKRRNYRENREKNSRFAMLKMYEEQLDIPRRSSPQQQKKLKKLNFAGVVHLWADKIFFLFSRGFEFDYCCSINSSCPLSRLCPSRV